MGVYRHLQNGDTTERSKKLKDHHMAGKIIIYPPALFEVYEIGRNAKFSQTLIWLTVVNRQNVSCPTGFQRFFLDVNSRTLSGAEPV